MICIRNFVANLSQTLSQSRRNGIWAFASKTVVKREETRNPAVARMVALRSGNAFHPVNKVTLRRAGLVL